MNPKSFIKTILIIGAMILNSYTFSQREQNKCDTVNIIAPAYLVLNDSSIHINRDTTQIICSKYIVLTKKNGYTLYSKLVKESNKHELVDKLFQLLIASSTQDTMLIKKALMDAEDAYTPYSGKIIKDIEIQVLKPFGPTISDTNLPVISTWGEALNKSHISTNKKVIERKLMFQVNDTIDPFELVENTNELAGLPYLQDATIIVSDIKGDSVSILVLVKDKFPWLPGINIYDINHMSAYLTNVNILGLGHSLKAGLTMDAKSSPLLYLSDVNYYIDNLYKQIKSTVNYQISDNDITYQLMLNRDIVPLSVRAGGGLEVTQREENIGIDPTSINKTVWYFKYRYYELWTSYLFYDKSKKNKANRKDVYLIPGVAAYKKDYQYRPYVAIDSNNRFENYTRLLSNFAIAKQNYYRTNYLKSFGKAEYIPYGFQATITGGYTWSEFMKSPYFGFGLAVTEYFNNVGYFFGNIEIGSHYSTKLEQGALKLNLSFLSSIFNKDRYKYRFLANLNFTNGINRYTNDLLYLGEDYGFIGMRDNAWYGQKRMFLELFTIQYTPWYLFGFRFAMFGFCSAGLLGESDHPIFKNQILSSVGIGVYSQNDFLAFNSFQFRVAYFPVTPSGISHFGVSFSTIGLIDQLSFLVTKPHVVEYN